LGVVEGQRFLKGALEACLVCRVEVVAVPDELERLSLLLFEPEEGLPMKQICQHLLEEAVL